MRKRVRAKSIADARRKASGMRTTVTKVNYIPGTLREGRKTYDVTTRKRAIPKKVYRKRGLYKKPRVQPKRRR